MRPRSSRGPCEQRNRLDLTGTFCFYLPAAGWKLNPVMGAMYAPELYTGSAPALTVPYLIDSSLIVSCFSSGQLPIPRSNPHPGVPGIRPTRSGTSRLQRHPLRCCACRRPSIPWVRASDSAPACPLRSLLFDLCHVLPQRGVPGRPVRSRSLCKILFHVFVLTFKQQVVFLHLIFFCCCCSGGLSCSVQSGPVCLCSCCCCCSDLQ